MPTKTPLYDTHESLGGKIVDFAGFLLPVQYKKGIIFEHNTVRTGVGLFDVSHMGEFWLRGDDAAATLRRLVTNRIYDMTDGQCRYTLMCYPDGGVVDDLLIYRISAQSYYIVVNAANIDKDFAYMSANLFGDSKIDNLSDGIGQIAMQGPLSSKVLEKLVDMSIIPVKHYRFVKDVDVQGVKCLISTTGYTGEAGYELYCAAEDTPKLYAMLLSAGEEFGIEPIGLGARDTLRFEAAMPLYGHELNANFNAAEAGLSPFIKTDEDFIGKTAIITHINDYERKGLRVVDRGIAREHCDVYDEKGEQVGYTTSGGVCPSLGGISCAMARLKVGLDPSKPLYIDVRGRKLRAECTPLPFYKR